MRDDFSSWLRQLLQSGFINNHPGEILILKAYIGK